MELTAIYVKLWKSSSMLSNLPCHQHSQPFFLYCSAHKEHWFLHPCIKILLSLTDISISDNVEKVPSDWWHFPNRMNNRSFHSTHSNENLDKGVYISCKQDVVILDWQNCNCIHEEQHWEVGLMLQQQLVLLEVVLDLHCSRWYIVNTRCVKWCFIITNQLNQVA